MDCPSQTGAIQEFGHGLHSIVVNQFNHPHGFFTGEDGRHEGGLFGTDRVDPENYRFTRLDTDSILLLEDGHCLRDHALAACRIRGTEKVRRFGASSLLTLIEMVDADLGVTFLPEMARGSSLLRNTRVRLWPLSDSSHRTIGLVWRKGSRRVDEFRLLGEFLKETRPG